MSFSRMMRYLEKAGVLMAKKNEVTGGIEKITAAGRNIKSALNASYLGAQKWFGSSFSNITVNVPGSPFAQTNGQLMLAEAPFVAVQLCIVNLSPNVLTGFKAVVGVTETIDTTVAANQFKPVIGGVAYGQLAAAGSINGFRPVTWGGAATVDMAAGTTVAQYAISDIIPLNSVPRADVPGALPAYIARLYHDGVNNGAHSVHTNFGTTMRAPTASNRGRVLQYGWASSDAVATLTTNLGQSSDGILFFPIFHYSVPALNVLVAGDSTEQNDALVSDKFTSWGWRGVADASTQGRPINYMNVGCSSNGSPTYWSRTQEIINAGFIPDVLVISPASVNDTYANPDRTFSDHKSRAMEIMRFAKAKGIGHVCFIPLLPYNSNTLAQDAYRLSFNAWLATILGASVLSFPALGNGASPERWNATYNFAADGVHPNELAIDTVMAPELTRYLNTI